MKCIIVIVHLSIWIFHLPWARNIFVGEILESRLYTRQVIPYNLLSFDYSIFLPSCPITVSHRMVWFVLILRFDPSKNSIWETFPFSLFHGYHRSCILQGRLPSRILSKSIFQLIYRYSSSNAKYFNSTQSPSKSIWLVGSLDCVWLWCHTSSWLWLLSFQRRRWCWCWSMLIFWENGKSLWVGG